VLEELGPWEGRYVPLGSLMDEVPEPSDRRPLGIAAEDAQISLEIDAPIALVHEVLTDFDQRFEWAVGMKDSVADSPINRVGGVHTCVFENFEVHVMTVDHQAAPDGFHYAESGESGGVTVVTDFQLRERDGVTLLMANQILGGRDKAKGGLAAVVQGLRGRVVLVLAKRGLARGLKQLKAYCERRHRDGSGAEEEVRAVAST